MSFLSSLLVHPILLWVCQVCLVGKTVSYHLPRVCCLCCLSGCSLSWLLWFSRELLPQFLCCHVVLLWLLLNMIPTVRIHFCYRFSHRVTCFLYLGLFLWLLLDLSDVLLFLAISALRLVFHHLVVINIVVRVLLLCTVFAKVYSLSIPVALHASPRLSLL